jgi:Protein of unknown function (DUF1559)
MTRLFLSCAVLLALVVPAAADDQTKQAPEPEARKLSTHNLKQLALAAHNFHDTNNRMPPWAIHGKDGKPLLSWRVAVLPYLGKEAEELYKQFKLDEPWDSDHNKKLIEKMPSVFKHPRAGDKPGLTRYQGFVGAGMIFDPNPARRVSLVTITDGTSNTLLYAEAAEAVEWTKPADLAYDAKKPLPKLYADWQGKGFFTAFADGSVRFVNAAVPEATLRALITPSGAEVLTLDD